MIFFLIAAFHKTKFYQWNSIRSQDSTQKPGKSKKSKITFLGQNIRQDARFLSMLFSRQHIEIFQICRYIWWSTLLCSSTVQHVTCIQLFHIAFQQGPCHWKKDGAVSDCRIQRSPCRQSPHRSASMKLARKTFPTYLPIYM